MTTHVGIDVSKDHLDWATATSAVQRLANGAAGIQRLVRHVSRLEPERVVVEATGGYERQIVEALAEADLPVVVVNAWRVHRFGDGLGVLAKTDPIEAQVLALFGERARFPIRPIASGPERRRSELIARRRQLRRLARGGPRAPRDGRSAP